MFGYKETLLKYINYSPAQVAFCPILSEFRLTISFAIFNFIAELDNAQLLAFGVRGQFQLIKIKFLVLF